MNIGQHKQAENAEGKIAHIMLNAPPWIKDVVFYQIFPERFYNGDRSNDPSVVEEWGNKPKRRNFFGGDLRGIIEKLSYLAYLGINAIYLTPIFKSPSNHKYDTSDYLEIDPHLGNLETLRELVKKGHERGIRLILDGVFNHSGDRFWAFEDVAKKGSSSHYSAWYFVKTFPVRKWPNPNYLTCGTARYLPKLNTDNPQVREYLFGVARYWLEEAGIDGWRLDVADEVSHDFWKEFRKVVRDANPDAFLVGELWGDASPWLQGDEFDGAMNYLLRDLIIKFFAWHQIDAQAFDSELARLRSKYPQEANEAMLNLLGSHDTPRYLTVCRGDVDKVVLSLLFLMTYIGVPMIYYGDEVGMKGGNDPLCRGTMIWDPTKWNRRIFDTCKKLIRIRREHPALRRGSFKTLYSSKRVYAYQREHGRDLLIVIINTGSSDASLKIGVDSAIKREPVRRKVVESGDITGTFLFRDILGGEMYPMVGDTLTIPTLKAKSGLLLEFAS